MANSPGHNSHSRSYKAAGIFQVSCKSEVSYGPTGVFKSWYFYHSDFAFYLASVVPKKCF